jgi:hypothetical protein
MRLVIAAAVFLAACSSGGDDKYDQSWPKSYGSTSCAEWQDEMSGQQRFVAAADMLVRGWRIDGVEDELPPDATVDRFAGAISQSCDGDRSLSISDAGGSVYLDDTQRFAP